MPIAPMPQLKASPVGRGLGPKPDKPAGLPPPKAPPGVRIEQRIGIQAPAEVIWSLIYDLASWAEWNPIYPKAAGAIRIGSQLEMTVALPGQSPMEIRPVVQEWVPNEQLHWRVSAMGGLIKTLRFIEIEALADTSCIVANGEYIGGFLGKTAAKRMGRSIWRGFGEMNEALKTRAEDLYARTKA